MILDLRDGRVRQRLRVSEERILSLDWRKEANAGRQPVTQRNGQAACQAGLEGLIVPSAANPNSDNLRVFPENTQDGSQLAIRNVTRLKP